MLLHMRFAVIYHPLYPELIFQDPETLCPKGLLKLHFYFPTPGKIAENFFSFLFTIYTYGDVKIFPC